MPALEQWRFPVDWSGGFRVRYEFRTSILPSSDGTEQRIAQRDIPRIRWEFNAKFLGREDFAEALLFASANQAREFDIPYPLEEMDFHVAVASAGSVDYFYNYDRELQKFGFHYFTGIRTNETLAIPDDDYEALNYWISNPLDRRRADVWNVILWGYTASRVPYDSAQPARRTLRPVTPEGNRFSQRFALWKKGNPIPVIPSFDFVFYVNAFRHFPYWGYFPSETDIQEAFGLGTHAIETVARAARVRFSGRTDFRAMTDCAATLPVRFDVLNPEDFSWDFAFIGEWTPKLTMTDHEGVEYTAERLSIPHNWASPVPASFDQDFSDLDSGMGGHSARRLEKPHTPRAAQFRFWCCTFWELNLIVGLFMRCKGRQRIFFAPTLLAAPSPKAAPAGSYQLKFDGKSLYDQIADPAIYAALEIELDSYPDDSPEARRAAYVEAEGIGEVNGMKVANATHKDSTGGIYDALYYVDSVAYIESSDETVMLLKNPLRQEIRPEEIKSLTFFAPSRFDDDSLTVHWHSPEFAEVTAKIRTIPLHEADADLREPLDPAPEGVGWGYDWGDDWGG